MRGHRAAFASLTLLPVLSVEEGAGSGSRARQPSKPAAAAATSASGAPADAAPARALLWEGRVLTVGTSDGCALVLGRGGLASRCHAVLQLGSGAVWLADISRHGTLLLELPEGSAVPGTDVTAAQLDALPWPAATALGSTSAQLPVGPARRALIVAGLHSADWLAAAKEGRMSREMASKGAALLLYEQFGPLPTAALQAEGQGMAPAQPPELAVALLPFARTPSRPQPQPRSNPEQRAKAPPPKPSHDPPRLHQAYNVFQLASVARKRSRPAEAAGGQRQQQPGGTGPAKKKKVRWSDELEGQGEPTAAMAAGGGRQQARGRRSSGKAPGRVQASSGSSNDKAVSGKAAADGGLAGAAAATAPSSKENVAQPAPGGQSAKTEAAVSKKPARQQGSARGSVATGKGSSSKAGAVPKAGAMRLLRRMQSGGGKAQRKKGARE